MTYVNVGACINRTRVATKAALKRALAEDPKTVIFDQTSPLTGGSLPQEFSGADVPSGVTIQVCGPDPFNNRRWYASVVKRPDGTVVVKT